MIGRLRGQIRKLGGDHRIGYRKYAHPARPDQPVHVIGNPLRDGDHHLGLGIENTRQARQPSTRQRGCVFGLLGQVIAHADRNPRGNPRQGPRPEGDQVGVVHSGEQDLGAAATQVADQSRQGRQYPLGAEVD